MVNQPSRMKNPNLKSDNLQYDTLGYSVDRLIDQASDY